MLRLPGKPLPFYLYLYGIEMQSINFDNDADRQFYLYLYGIEIRRHGTIMLRSVRFTCTFMELKSQNDVQNDILHIVLLVPLWNWNISGRSSPSADFQVLLVALWNWNRPLKTLNQRRAMFYLYLYGIEISTLAFGTSWWIMFYLYLYGIEMTEKKIILVE